LAIYKDIHAVDVWSYADFVELAASCTEYRTERNFRAIRDFSALMPNL